MKCGCRSGGASGLYRADAAALFAHHTPDRWNAPHGRHTGDAGGAHREITGGTTEKNSSATGGSRRANAWLTLLSRLFTLGVAGGHCTLNPTGIKKNDEVHRERFLSGREISALWRYLQQHRNVEAAACVQFILLTGCRPGEAYTMQWADLDKSTGAWRKPAARTKQRKVHMVRLTNRALVVLDRLATRKRSTFAQRSSGTRTRRPRAATCTLHKSTCAPKPRSWVT